MKFIVIAEWFISGFRIIQLCKAPHSGRLSQKYEIECKVFSGLLFDFSVTRLNEYFDDMKFFRTNLENS
jgi:hypothetical protein